MRRLVSLLVLSAVLVCASCSIAFADGPAGTDPSSNFPVDQLPGACSQPSSAACLDASVALLNQARAGLGQGPYQLPTNFDSLSPDIQQFILANLDRIQYGLTPITGITASLTRDAMAGVTGDTDPHPTDTNFNYWTANWAGGFENVVVAYEAWMYDDGPGSGNLDCGARGDAGCWGHRHDILWSFGGAGALAMGSAVGTDSSGSPGYAMLLGQGQAGSYQPAYTYTWSQAVADGAGSAAPTGSAGTTGTHPAASPSAGSSAANSPASAAAKRITITVTVHGTGVIVDPTGHSCHDATCSFSEAPGHPVRLVAHAAGHSTFTGWSGQCRGAGTTCRLTPASAGARVGARFHRAHARLSRRRAHRGRAHAGRLLAARLRVY